jgi:hypothetical protein
VQWGRRRKGILGWGLCLISICSIKKKGMREGRRKEKKEEVN